MVDYVAHVCKNSKKPEFIDDPKLKGHSKKKKVKNPEFCDRIWVDVDKTNVTDTPSRRLYCEDCVKKGFKNPKTREMSDEQVEAFKLRMAKSRAERAKAKKNG